MGKVMAKTKIEISDLQSDDFPGWLPLWDKNNQGLRNQDVTSETWSRLLNPASSVHGMKAADGDTIIGIMHYILHNVTGHIEPACYMQDLYIDPNHRRKGAAKGLIQALEKRGRTEKWARIYWLAENTNEEAQALYKNIGLKLNFSLHVLPTY